MDPDRVTLAKGAEAERVVDDVRQRYARIAKGEEAGCCGPKGVCGSPEGTVALGLGYRAEELAEVPSEANLGLGCGAPLDFLGLQPGETVLDLGSGPGLDALLAARKVGPSGRVIGVDMTPPMIDKARANAARLGFAQVEFRLGRLEALPVPDAAVDAVTSNCVINLVPDKGAVFTEAARVLRPGGRLVISDVVLDGPLPPAVEKDVMAYVGCISGGAQRADYFRLVREAGLVEIEVLRDVDFLAAMEAAAPEEVAAVLERTGVALADVAGKVRSVTFRAVKPGAARA
jgi:arsenite methyltransferase